MVFATWYANINHAKIYSMPVTFFILVLLFALLIIKLFHYRRLFCRLAAHLNTEFFVFNVVRFP